MSYSCSVNSLHAYDHSKKNYTCNCDRSLLYTYGPIGGSEKTRPQASVV